LKYINKPGKLGRSATDYELLYDLIADPYELTNLADSSPEKCQEMKEILLNELEKTREPFFDVIIRHGVKQYKPDIDVSCVKEGHPGMDS